MMDSSGGIATAILNYFQCAGDWAHFESTAIWRLESRQNPHAGKRALHVAQPFQAAGWRSFPAPQGAPACGGTWWYFQEAPWVTRAAFFRLLPNAK